jgi:hypothetical protein
MIRDRNIEWMRQIRRIPYYAFGMEPTQSHTITLTDSDSAASAGVAVYYDEDATAGAKLLFVSPTNASSVETLVADESLTGMDDGDPEITEVTALGYGGILIATAGDSFSHLDIVHPSQWDVQQEIGVRVIYTTNATVSITDSITWAVTYAQSDIQEALVAPTTALDTVIAAQTPSTTSLGLRRTSRGIINANKFDYASRLGGIGWNVEADALSGYEVTDVVFLGLEIDFIPQLCAGAEEKIDAFSSAAASA